MKIRIFSLVLFLSIIVTGAWAQNLPGFPLGPGENSKHTWASSVWTSAQSSTTEGRYRSNADDFIRPDSYTGVKFNKWFGMTSFLWAGEENSGEMIATLGFATKVSNIYIGALYTGNLWTGLAVNNYTEEVPGAPVAGGSAGTTYNTYSSISVSAVPGNNFAVLIGVADMGFRLTYRTNHQAFKQSDIVIGSMLNGYKLYNSYETDEGYIAPQIAWAMAKDLTKNGIRPYVGLDLVFYREFLKYQDASDTVSGERIGYSKNRFDPSLSAGLGGYTLYNKDGFKLSADVDYVLTFNIYNNEYSYPEGGSYKTGKINGWVAESGDLIEAFYVSNLLTPSLSGSWSKDALSLKFKLNLPIMLSTREGNSAALDPNNNLYYNGQNESTTTFTFRPDIRLAMQYKVIPNRIILNLGARLQATMLTLETVEQANYDPLTGVLINNKKIHRDKVLNDATGTQFVSRFNIGPTIYFTDNVWLEATTGVSKAFGEGAVNLFGTGEGSLFVFGSLLFALKF